MKRFKIDTEHEDISKQLQAWLNEQTSQMVGEMSSIELKFAVRDADGTLLGGITGRVTLKVLHIQLLALSPQARGSGLGSALIKQLENAAREQGAVEAWVDTLEWKAPGFYRKQGYEMMGAVGEVRHRKYFGRKSLL